jgi:hypothetical protein
VQGAVVDRPHAEAGARALAAECDVVPRFDFIAGDFFASLPANADVYLLKSILHDWDDADARRILETCRAAMARTSRLIVVERALPKVPSESSADRAVARSDLQMLVALAGKERSLAAFEALFAACGLTLVRATPVVDSFSVLEACLAVG